MVMIILILSAGMSLSKNAVMDSSPIIQVENVWKRYGLPPLLPWTPAKADESAYALRGVSFSVPRGGSLGILGRNGAGKSTLLKLLAGVTPTDRGSIIIRGSIFPMIELVAGMSMELSGRDNTRVLGTIMGKNTDEIEALVPNVQEFSELGDWFDRPVWQYSSGMLGRLAFGVAVNIRADILLVDEVLATGDISFQKKCERKMREILSSGATLVLVTHSPYQASRLCEQGIVMGHGSVLFSGSGQDARSYYLQEGLESTEGIRPCGDKILPESYPRDGSGQLRVTRVAFENSKGEIVHDLVPGESYCVLIFYTVFEEIYDINISLRFLDTENRVALSFSTSNAQVKFLPVGKGVFKCSFKNFPIVSEYVTLQIKVAAGMLSDLVNDVLLLKINMTKQQMLETGNLSYAYTPGKWEVFQDNVD